MTAPAPSIDYAALKSGGIIMQKDDDLFAIRLRLPGGSISADLPPRIAEMAWKYGRGKFISPPGRLWRLPAGSGEHHRSERR